MSNDKTLVDAIEGLQKRNRLLEKRNRAYQQAINALDDFFEYANESKSDREQVHKVLDNLTLKLSTLK